MQASTLYRLTAGCLVVHELQTLLTDAQHAFWGPSWGAGNFAQDIIIWSHAPVVFVLVLAAEGLRSAVLRYGVCVFGVLHAGLHWAYRGQFPYEAGSITSWVLILLAAIFGAAYLVPQKAR